MSRRTLALVRRADGLLHAFDAGNFPQSDRSAVRQRSTASWCAAASPRRAAAPAPTTAPAKEVWAWVPPSLVGKLKNNVGGVFGNPSYPEAEVDGSVAVDDIYYTPAPPLTGMPNNQFVTAAFASVDTGCPGEGHAGQPTAVMLFHCRPRLAEGRGDETGCWACGQRRRRRVVDVVDGDRAVDLGLGIARVAEDPPTLFLSLPTSDGGTQAHTSLPVP